MNISVRLEEEKDFSGVENITREAFWDLYRPGCCEHLVAHKLRKSQAFVKELSYVACEDDIIVGSIIYSSAKVINGEGSEGEVLCMGPLSVLPSYQGKGVGSSLLNHSIETAKALGFKAVIIFGNPKYYQRFGFVNAERYNITTPAGENFDAFMALELYAGALNGITGKFYEDKAFEIADDELEIFEREFPYKEKHITNTQFK